MSTTFDIGCVDCKLRLWVGQRDYIYNTPEHLKKLSEFLLSHEGHHLIVATEATECKFGLDECEYIPGTFTDEDEVDEKSN